VVVINQKGGTGKTTTTEFERGLAYLGTAPDGGPGQAHTTIGIGVDRIFIESMAEAMSIPRKP
jgi:hypothetical protein